MSGENERWSEWMRRAQGGDPEAYRALVEELYPVTTRYLRTLLFDAQTVDDCVQDCLLALHRARSSYDPRRPFGPWYFTIVRHRARDSMRKRRVETRALALDRDDAALRDALHFEVRADLDRLLGRLRPAYREALELTKLQGLSMAEAAHKAGVRPGTMKARVHRGLAQLARAVHRNWTES